MAETLMSEQATTTNDGQDSQTNSGQGGEANNSSSPDTANAGNGSTDETNNAGNSNDGQDNKAKEEQGDSKDESEKSDESKKSEVPEKYEFKAPEGKTFDTEFIKSFEETARKLNLSQDKAQQLIDDLSPVLEQRQMAQIEAVKSQWAEQSKTDAEFGGDKLDENLALAKTALDKYGNDELKALINQSGIGNHPEVIRFFYKVGKETSPDTFVGGDKGGGKEGPKSFNDMAQKLYS